MSEVQVENSSAPRVKQRRSKTSVACNHCHRSHMTCDSNRPCSRCIKRNLQDTCQDAPRKRKKYLAGVPMEAIRTGSGSSRNLSGNMQPMGSQMSIQTSQSPSDHSSGEQSGDVVSGKLTSYNGVMPAPVQPQNHTQTSPMAYTNDPQVSNAYLNDFSDNMMKTRSKFMSSAAGLEYSTLSSIISDNFLPTTSNDHTPNSGLSPAISPNVGQVSGSPNSAINDAFLMGPNQDYKPPLSIPQTAYSQQNYMPQPSQQPRLAAQVPGTQQKPYGSTATYRSNIYDKAFQYDEAINQYFLGVSSDSRDQFVMFPDVLQHLETLKDTDPAVYYERNSKSSVSVVVGVVPEDATSNYAYMGDTENGGMPSYIKEPEDIYEKVKKPYSYTPGYHALIAYLRKRFNKEMLVKMAETMASYRPSFIACTNSLKEHDLIFMEQCFQRTLLTYDSIIKVSGTPTIVWRRTGEIAYVGSEFCVLTGYSRDELITSKKKLIVELLDDKSVLEYFQLFSKIAFGDFLGATMTECTLLGKKNNSKIKTRCLWTLKRDVFGIPMMIIGSFLPIL